MNTFEALCERFVRAPEAAIGDAIVREALRRNRTQDAIVWSRRLLRLDPASTTCLAHLHSASIPLILLHRPTPVLYAITPDAPLDLQPLASASHVRSHESTNNGGILALLRDTHIALFDPVQHTHPEHGAQLPLPATSQPIRPSNVAASRPYILVAGSTAQNPATLFYQRYDEDDARWLEMPLPGLGAPLSLTASSAGLMVLSETHLLHISSPTTGVHPTMLGEIATSSAANASEARERADADETWFVALEPIQHQERQGHIARLTRIDPLEQVVDLIFGRSRYFIVDLALHQGALFLLTGIGEVLRVELSGLPEASHVDDVRLARLGLLTHCPLDAPLTHAHRLVRATHGDALFVIGALRQNATSARVVL